MLLLLIPDQMDFLKSTPFIACCCGCIKSRKCIAASQADFNDESSQVYTYTVYCVLPRLHRHQEYICRVSSRLQATPAPSVYVLHHPIDCTRGQGRAGKPKDTKVGRREAMRNR